MESSYLDEVRGTAKEFFHQPSAEKQKYARQDNEVEGYTTGPALSGVQQLEWADRLRLLVAPENLRNPKYWPESPENFR